MVHHRGRALLHQKAGACHLQTALLHLPFSAKLHPRQGASDLLCQMWMLQLKHSLCCLHFFGCSHSPNPVTLQGSSCCHPSRSPLLLFAEPANTDRFTENLSRPLTPNTSFYHPCSYNWQAIDITDAVESLDHTPKFLHIASLRRSLLSSQGNSIGSSHVYALGEKSAEQQPAKMSINNSI